MIAISRAIVWDMVEHAREEAPVEACGLLAGVGASVAKSYRLSNIDASPDHFSLDPKEQFAAVKDARALGLEIIGVYHSHPATPARMSNEDLRLAFAPEFRYVIVSLADGRREGEAWEGEAPAEPYAVRCFIVQDGRPVEEPVEVEEHE